MHERKAIGDNVSVTNRVSTRALQDELRFLTKISDGFRCQLDIEKKRRRIDVIPYIAEISALQETIKALNTAHKQGGSSLRHAYWLNVLQKRYIAP